MTLTANSFTQFIDDNYQLLQKNLGEQLQKHFNLLVELVPNIQSIEWTSSQEDEMVFELIEFQVVKNNGYTFAFSLYADNDGLSEEEFNFEEKQLIAEFIDYLDSLSNLIVTLWGSQSFRLEGDKNLELVA